MLASSTAPESVNGVGVIGMTPLKFVCSIIRCTLRDSQYRQLGWRWAGPASDSRHLKCGLTMDGRGIEDRNCHVVLSEQHADLGAAQNKAVGPCGVQALSDPLICSSALVGDYVPAQLVIDDPVRFGPVHCVGKNGLKASGSQLIRVEVLLHCECRRHQARLAQ